ncbi:hypothetical protein IE077_003482, partial [Cardiosporidium cionae]
ISLLLIRATENTWLDNSEKYSLIDLPFHPIEYFSSVSIDSRAFLTKALQYARKEEANKNRTSLVEFFSEGILS